LADWLVGQKVPFREAHHLVGEVVGLAEKLAKPLNRLTLKELRGVSRKFKAGALEVFELKQALAKRTATGSPGTKEVKKTAPPLGQALGLNRKRGLQNRCLEGRLHRFRRNRVLK
jgi:argininosuccinate lyase